jgi:hypothetical protein
MILDGHVPSLAVAGFAQALAECALTLRGRTTDADITDHWQRSLLGLGRERPPRHTAEPSDEFAPPKANAHLPLLVPGNSMEARLARPSACGGLPARLLHCGISIAFRRQVYGRDGS